jgi:predicted  nucleic acid-binding Zn-ribbon protein
MRIILFTLAMMFSLSVFSQARVGINEIQLTTSKGDQPAFEFFIPDSDERSVLESWNKFHKKYKAKPKQDKNNSNYYFTDNAIINALSENSIDIYSRIYETGGGVRFACAFDLGGVFISSKKTPAKFNEAKLLLNRFYAQMSMDAIVAEITLELERLENIRYEYIAVNEEIAAYESTAAACRATISESEREAGQLQAEIQLRSGELDGQKEQLTQANAELKQINKDDIGALLAGYSTALKKVDLETNKIEKDILSKTAEIVALEAEIDLLTNDLEEKKAFRAELQKKITTTETRMETLDIAAKEDRVVMLKSNIGDLESIHDELKQRKSNFQRTIDEEGAKLENVKQALGLSKEKRNLLEEKLAEQEKKLRELEEIKATID